MTEPSGRKTTIQSKKNTKETKNYYLRIVVCLEYSFLIICLLYDNLHVTQCVYDHCARTLQ